MAIRILLVVHDLVEAFRSTLEEVALASLVVHVADASAPDVDEQIEAVRGVLGEIGAGGIPEVLVLNKADLLADGSPDRILRRFPDGVAVSALVGDGLDALLERVEERLPSAPIEIELLVPYNRQDVVARLHREAEILTTESRDDGTWVRARLTEAQLSWAGEFALKSVARRVRLSG